MVVRTATVSSGFAVKEPIPAGSYSATLVKVEATEVPEQTFGGKVKAAGPGFYLTYAVKDDQMDDGGEDEFRFLRKRVRESFYDEKGKQSSLVVALRALAISPPQNGETYDDDDWLGAGCMATVDTYVGTDGNEHNGIAGFSLLPNVLKRTMATESARAREAFAAYDAAWEARRAAKAAASEPDF